MGRSPCCEKVGLKRGRWTAEEDDILRRYIQSNGEGSWRSLPKNAGLLRCGKSCRLRWINYLRSDLKRGKFSAEEDELIINLQASLGTRWCLIASHFPGRTDNEIKNYWNSHLSRKIHNFTRSVGSRELVSPSMVDEVMSKLLNKHKGHQSSKSAMNKTKSYSSTKLPLSPSDQFIKNSNSSVSLADKQTVPGVISLLDQENLRNHEPSEIENDTVLESGYVVSQNLSDLIMEIASYSNEELSDISNGISPLTRNGDASIDISALSEEPEAGRWGLWKEEDLIGGDWWESSSSAKPDLKKAELNWENVQLDANAVEGNEFPGFWDTYGFGEAYINDMAFGINMGEQMGAVLASLLE